VGVVGGGDTATKWAAVLADIGARSVTVFVRGKELKAEATNRERLAGRSEVGVVFGAEVTALEGTPKLAAVRYKVAGRELTKTLQGLFVAIGSRPRGEIATRLGVKLDRDGQVDVNPRTMATSVDGVYAAGDVTNASGSFKQIVTGAAEGAIAATSAYLDTQRHAGVCALHAAPIAGLLETPDRCRAKAAKRGRGSPQRRSKAVRRPAKRKK
jgi:thioredoxin reductase (NADPH)